MHHKVFFDDVVDAGRHDARLHVGLDLFDRHGEEFREVVIVIRLQRDQQFLVILDVFAVEFELFDRVRALAVLDPHAFGKLVELGVALPGLIAQHELDHLAELFARHLEHPEVIIERGILHHVLILHDRPERLLADGAGAHHHNIETAVYLQQVGVEVAQFRFLRAGRVRELPRKRGDDAVELLVHLALVAVQEMLHDRVGFSCFRSDRNALPFPFEDLVADRIVFNIKASDVSRAGSHLHDRHAVYYLRFFHQCVRVAADDQIHAPVRVQQLCQLAVCLDADVRQQDDHVRVARAVVIADDTDLFGGCFYIDKGADDFFGLCHRQHFLCQNADEQNLQAADFLLQIWLEETGVVERH